MNNDTPPVIRRRKLWPWVVLAAVLTPVIVVAGAAYSYVHLERNADMLRRQVMSTNQSDWKTVVQFSMGSATLTSIRSCLHLVRTDEFAQVRQALATVHSASVGVYELRGGLTATADRMSIDKTDTAMQERGWTRVVAVIDGNETVLIYLPEDTDEPNEICLAVQDGEELVIVSARINPEALVELIEEHAGDDLREALRHI